MDHSLQVEILKELMHQLDEGKNIDAGVQYRMPTSSYICPDVAAQEWQTFFAQHPQLIGLSGDLPGPGTFLTTDDFGTPILATRDKDGTYRAFLNVCRHRAVKVATEERGRQVVFTCPFHHWSYGGNGALLNVSDESDFGQINRQRLGLVELPAVEQGGLLWVHPLPDGKLDLDELLGETLASELEGFALGDLVFAGHKTIDMQLNWKLANDTFGETYHFQKLHRNTLGRIYLGNNLHLKEFGRHHRFVTANRGIETMRALPETDWNILKATFVLYFLFPNIQMVVNEQSVSLIRIYPDRTNPGRSVTRISFYYSRAAMDDASRNAGVTAEDVYSIDARQDAGPSLAASLEVFRSTVEHEDYLMGEMQQRAAENGLMKEIIFGRNEPALHHFHQSYREALNLPPLEETNAP